ncbi:BrnA antitoxin family protein [Enterovirga aerilata]|uniref:BrnA antitoxin family protein n=1 Tax=Enterovirga aerilata TaxID=2730920 RepID=A0A849I5Y8_9HYPH|nr:BrnA antitoxin family protein [Enterovirga sp. DB1703]NNM75276.1 hypothetical protein [Enterovirga sp. DB1703]
MARKPNPGLIDDDAPELSDAELAEMRPARDALPPELYAALTQRKPGQRGPGKKPAMVPVTVRLAPDVVAAFKATGENWQKLMRDAIVAGRPDRAESGQEPRPDPKRTRLQKRWGAA